MKHCVRALGAIAVSAVMTLAAGAAQAWEPTRPVDVIVHTGPGGGSDLLARAIATMMQTEKLLPVRMQVLNKTGGNGAVAAAAIAQKKNDPYTLGLITSGWIANPLTSNEAKVTLNDLQPVVGLIREPALIVVRADSSYKTLKDFVEAARAKPGQLRQSGGSVTARDNVIRETLQHFTGTKWAFVSFQGGGERLAALLGGHVDMMVIEPQEAGEQIRAGKLRALAQIAESPLAAYPGVPTVKQAGYDVSLMPQIRAVLAPPGMPKEAVEYWQDRFEKLTQTASWKKFVADSQFEEDFSKGEALSKEIAEIEKEMRKQFEQAGIKMVR